MEEVGLDVEKSSTLLGRLPSIYPGSLEVICYVFALNKGFTWNPVLQESEIRACGWAPLADLLHPKPVPFVIDLAENPIIQLSFWAPYLGLSQVVYTAVFLRITDRVPACFSPKQVPTKLPKSYRESANLIAESGAFMLWGLTLQLCNKFLIQSGLGEPVVLRGIFGVPKIFASDVHNVLIAPLRGHSRHWSQVLRWYQTALLGLASAFLIGGGALVKFRMVSRSRI
eukprot:GEMP01057147.1.p1 GENE.GEMP01057147.1~~GEMP01057147.1.p1  ORF type:complete len:227 (+),score=32.95 GEMP01057147.1:475-1155(+)